MISVAPMDVRFRSRDLLRLCNDHIALKGRWGPRAASALAQTLHELAALEDLADLETLPYIRLQRRREDGAVLVESIGDVRLRMTAHSSAGASARSWKACDSVVITEIEILKK